METKTYRNKLLGQYHVLANKKGMLEEHRAAFLEGTFGVSSSRNLNNLQLKQAIDILQAKGHEASEGDQWRKRVIASVGGWLRSINKENNLDVIKSIACRAAGCSNFNAIPVARLRNIYYEFRRNSETVGRISEIVTREIEHQVILN
ncbi:MAG: hypothetical protein HC896_00235 [Bacteroidales bacterium]|nr:hypothetical protein [Bacteroidales bacterium]